MDERQLELLRKALELYTFTIEQRKDNDESNEFFHMKEKLSEILGVNVEYFL